MKNLPGCKIYGYVYVVEFAESHVKIGRSRNPSLRLNAISTQSGMPIRQVWVSELAKNYEDMEIAAHTALRQYRGTGEYFAINFDDAVSDVSSLPFDVVSHDQAESDYSEKMKSFSSMSEQACKDLFSEIASIDGSVRINDPGTKREAIRLVDYALNLVTQAFLKEIADADHDICDISFARSYAIEFLTYRAKHLNEISCMDWTDVA